MIIPASCKIPTLGTLKKESDPKKRINGRLDIGRLTHSQPETDLATLKKEIRPRRAMLWQMGFSAGKSSSNGPHDSHSPYLAQTAEIASTDTPSDVSVAVSQARQRFATLAATDPRLISAE